MDSERRQFADPGGRSALRAASRRNPRSFPCPTCKTPNVLTPADVRRGYQCDRCADRDEGVGYYRARKPRESMATASAKRQCRVCGSWFMTTTQRDNHERQKHQSVRHGVFRTRTLAAGTGVIIREPHPYAGRFGVVVRPPTSSTDVGVRVYRPGGRTSVYSIRLADLSVRGAH